MSTRRASELLEHLRDGGEVPSHLAEWLRLGIETHQAGGDLAAALDLPGPDLERRNALIGPCILLSPGESLLSKCEHFLSCIRGERRHNHDSVQSRIEKLRLVPVPGIRQLLRIAQQRREAAYESLLYDTDDD